jgi:hypothetical protein
MGELDPASLLSKSRSSWVKFILSVRVRGGYQKTNILENEYEQCSSNANHLSQWNRHTG